ncbi:MAG TPA: pantoate--beta-alanine ligase [Novimethylophilus sp.]|jgi:pantoate--beta-alanine ligase|uniref:pantoate--beta-alanine ligase n=1 Tax=Novimethylophilus sp. TaxID=2137426 RepID=UPI002F425751
MEIISRVPELRERLHNVSNIAFVPTMGNLHAGHISLMEQARQHGDCIVASIFVNPLQFGANEDLASYPRTLAEDCRKLYAAGVDVVFTPNEADLYPQPQTVIVQAPPIAGELCGAYRPGHFDGVATIVLKLFNLLQPQAALFGNKDFQQLFIIREMVRQLNVPVAIVAGETVREADGLAMSSRNGYLRPEQRVEAPRLFKALQQVVKTVRDGRRDFKAIETQTMQYLTMMGWIVDYIEVRSADTLAAAAANDRNLVVLGAARLGKTRLIDNIEFCVPQLN